MAIKKLDPIVANRIAAGEVVEKPSSVLRELLDNSIDAKASKINVFLEEGGIKSLTVSDNGCGFSKEDLPLACLSHATSKIETLDDLYALRTLGFRGEALCSISSCSKLTIQSNGYQITVDNGLFGSVIPSSVSAGTVIIMENLFENIPARKQFLKRPSSEASDCKKVFIEKALGFENTEFNLYIDSKLELHFDKKDRKGRVLDILSLDKDFSKADFMEMELEAEPVKLYAVASKPNQYKRDRSQIKILVNDRVIDNYALAQAINASYSVALPGGAFPYFVLYIQDSPTMVDFNIHPAKRECKIRNQSSIYGMLTKMVRESLLNLNKNPIKEIKPEIQQELVSYSIKEVGKQEFVSQPKPSLDPSWFESAKKVLSKTNIDPKKQEKPSDVNYKYIGQVFNTFLVAEVYDKILFIDQHAAHERILYDKLVANPDRQALIVPYQFETDVSVDDFLTENSVVYQEFGVELVKVKPMLWEITSLPAVCRKNEKEIASYIQKATGDIFEAQKGLFAVIACHSAIKAGDILDDYTATQLLEKVFKLDAMLCPHGRSFCYEISKEELYKEVGRIV